MRMNPNLIQGCLKFENCADKNDVPDLEITDCSSEIEESQDDTGDKSKCNKTNSHQNRL